MKTIDLTHRLHENTPAYPGTDPPKIVPANTLSSDGFRESLLTIFSHTGTHMDAPAHLLAEGRTLDSYAADHFLGSARVLRADRGAVIDLEMITSQIAAWSDHDYLLLATGWDQYWGEPGYFENFPTLTVEAAEFLAGAGLKGIGVDAISIDPVENAELPIHRILLGAGLVIVENLKGLTGLPDTCWFCALPLHFQHADGAPVRALARHE